MIDKPPARSQSSGLNLSLPDVYFIIFRHKWKILGIFGLAVLAALLLPLIRPVPYQSEAKLYIRYVLESKSPTQVDANDSTIHSPDLRGDSLVNTELEILTSLDLAQQVADTIGPEKIAGKANTADRYKAALLLRKNLTVEVPKNSTVIRLIFQHRNPEIVQPVLSQLMDFYFRKHSEIHAVGVFDDVLTQETDQIKTTLAEIEQDLKKAMTNAGVISLPETKKFQTEEIARLRQAIFEAEAELAECKVTANEAARVLRSQPGGATNSSAAASAERLAEYTKVTTLLETLRRKEQEFLLLYTPESVMLKQVQEQIADKLKTKKQLEEENPDLLTRAALLAAKRGDGPTAPHSDLANEMARATALDARIETLKEQLQQIQKEAAAVADAESTINELQRKRDIADDRYKKFIANLDQSRFNEKLGSGKVMNISTIQKASPPSRDPSKLLKARLGLIIGGFAAALGLAFLLEMFLDTSLKRPFEIENKLGLPLFMTIPLMTDRPKSAWIGRFRQLRLWPQALSKTELPAESAVSTLHSALPLSLFFDGLRDRLISFFELKNLTHKPKLVAVTSCGEGSGVTTIASGLAASLSETGDGNVLLVDMSHPNGTAQHYVNGRPRLGLDAALETQQRSAALVQDNLYMVTEYGPPASDGNGVSSGIANAIAANGAAELQEALNGTAVGENQSNGEAHLNGSNHEKLPRVLPKRFTSLMPKLKASDYDYIIFDMPPISQVSITPRIAKHMDMVLLVVEAERTEIEVLKRATAFLSESKPNLAAILNKRRTHVPKLLQQEL